MQPQDIYKPKLWKGRPMMPIPNQLKDEERDSKQINIKDKCIRGPPRINLEIKQEKLKITK